MSAMKFTLPPLGPGGDAIFSTHLGRFPPRAAGANPRCIIIRSSPEDDRDSMIASLEAKFPAQCKLISSPITNLCQYFDEYDLQLHGAGFIYSVLEHIALKNVWRWRDIFTYVDEWCSLNSTNIPFLDSLQMDAFTEEDHQEYGREFLSDAFGELLRRKMKSEIDGESPLQLLAPLEPADSTSEFSATYARSMQDVQTQNTNVMHLDEPGQGSRGRVQFDGRQLPGNFQGQISGFQYPQGPFVGPSFPEPPHFMLESAAMQHHYPMPVGPATGRPEVPFVKTAPNAYRRPDHSGGPGAYSSNHSGILFYDSRVAPPAPRAMSQFAHNPAMLNSGPSVRRKHPPMPFSNDARVLERSGVPMRRRSFGHTSGNLSPKSRPNQRMPYQWHETHPVPQRFPLPSIQTQSSYSAEGGSIPNPNPQMPFGADPQNITLTEQKERFPSIDADTLSTSVSSTCVDPHRTETEGNNGILPETTIQLDQQVSSMYVLKDYDQRAKQSLNPRPDQDYQQIDTQSTDSSTLMPSVNTDLCRFPNQNILEHQETAAKLWIGGLRSDLDVKDLAGVLTPWQPFHIQDNLRINSSKYDHGYPGYIFVNDTDMAEAVIQNLHRKWSDALQCQPSVNYARGRNQNYRDGARTSPQKYKSQGSPRKQYNRKKDFSSQARSKDNADPAVEHVELQDIPENAGADKDLPFSVARRATVVSHPSSQQPPAEAEAMQEANQVDAKAIDHALMSAEKEQLQALSGRAICEFKSTPGENSTDTAELGPTESHFEVCSSTPTTSATAPAATQRTPKKKKGRKQSNITTERSINEAKQNRSDKKSRKTSLPEKLEDSKQRKELISGFGKESGEANVSESIKCSGTLLDSSSKVLGKDSNNNPELAPSDTTQWPPLNTSKSTTLQPDVSGREQYGMKQQNTVRKVTSSESSGLNFEQLGTKSSLLTDPSSDGQSERLLNETATESIAAYDATDKERTRHESSLEVSSRPAGDIAASNTANIPDGSIPQHSGKQNSIEQELVSGARSQAEESVKFSSGRETHKKNPVSQPIETKSTNIKQSHSKTTKGRRVIKENASKTQSAKAKMPLVTDSKEIVQKDSLQPMPVPNDPLNSSFPKGNKFTKSHAGTEMVEKPSNCVESITLPAKTEPSIESALVSDHSVKAQIHLENTALPRKHAIDECMDEKTKSCQDTSDQRAMKSNVAADATRPSEVLNESKSVNAVQVPNKQFYELDSPTSLATSTTPIYTHKKKQKKLSLIESKSSNPYEALGSETVENPTQELSDGNINVKGKELQVVSSHLPNSSSEISTGVGVIVSSVNENEDSSTANKGFSGVSTSNPDGRSKSKKKLKKSKKARSSQSNLALVSSNQSSLNQANGSRTLPSVETPFLTDDKKPLPRPVIHNRPSGDKATKGTPSNYQCVLHSNSVILVEEWLKYRQGNPFGQTRLSGDLEDYSNEKEAGYEPGLYSLFPENAINQDHSAQNNGNTFLPLRSISADYDAEEESQSHKFKPVVYPVQGTESEANNQVAVQHELDQSKCPGSNDQEDGSTEEQVRSNQVEVDRYLKANGKASREALLRLLNSIVPEKESPKSYGDGEFGSAESRELGDVLPEEVDIASPDGAASGTPRVFEIIEEIPPLPPPPRSLKQRDIRLLPSRSPSPTVPISRDESEIERPELTPLTTANTTPKAESQPRTPPPGMFHQSTALRELHHHTDDPVSPPTSEQHQIDERQVIGASEEITNPPLPTEIGSSATISPIHTPKVKTLSYKDVASTPPASSLQESDFPPLSGNGKGGHVGPKAKQENRERGRAGSAAEKKRRASQKADPWRVVSTSWGEPTTKHTNK